MRVGLSHYSTEIYSSKTICAKNICHLSFYRSDPFIEEGCEDDRCLVTDADHLSSVIPYGSAA